MEKLLSALTEMDARYRDPGGRVIRPEISAFAGEGHHLLMTRFGPLDVLGKIAGLYRYEELIEETEHWPLAGFSLQILSLATQIRIKETLGREKDRAALGWLRQALLARGSR